MCLERSAVFGFTPKVVKAATGEIVASRTFRLTDKDDKCGDLSSVRSGDEMVSVLRTAAIGDFRDHIAPHYVTVDIPLLLEDDSNIPVPVKALIDNGYEWAKADNMERACETWDEAASRHTSGYALPYLQGVCAEVTGDHEDALRRYKLAARLSAKPVPEIGESIARVEDAMRKNVLLGKQLRNNE
jgi:hypothetical protein